MRFDPRLSREELTEALVRDAGATWGEDRAGELRPALETTASAIWLVAQERLEPTDVEP
jgi:hypothetical protein